MAGTDKYKEITFNYSCTYSEKGTYNNEINHLGTIVPPEVVDQGEQEICYAIASCKLAETAIKKAGTDFYPLSIEHTVYGCYPPGADVKEGGTPAAALEFLKNTGACLVRDSDARAPIPPGVEKRTIDDWYPVSDEEEVILRALQENVLLISVNNYSEFSALRGKVLLDMQLAKRLSKTKPEKHSLLLVGAGFFVPDDQPDMPINYWIVKNSWSSVWGDDGIGYLIRDSTLRWIHPVEVKTAYFPYYAYVKREGQAEQEDPDFQSIVQRGISVDVLRNWVIQARFKEEYLLFFFYHPENCAALDIVPDQLVTAIGKVLHFQPSVKVALVNVAEEHDAIETFQLDGQQPAHLLLYTEWLHPDPRSILSARRYEGEFNLGDIMSWYNDIAVQIVHWLDEGGDEEDMEEV